MPGSLSAVGAKSFKPNGARSIENRVSNVEGRMDALEQTLASNRAATAQESQATHELLTEVLSAVGKPSNGPGQPASGVYWAIAAVSERLSPFEQRWQQVKGGLTVLAAVGVPAGALIWFMEGHRLSQMFGG